MSNNEPPSKADEFLIHTLWENVCCFKPLSLGLICYPPLVVSYVHRSFHLVSLLHLKHFLWHFLYHGSSGNGFSQLLFVWKVFYFTFILKDLFTQYRILGWFISLKISFHCFDEYSGEILIFIPVNVFLFYISSLIFSSFIMMCPGVCFVCFWNLSCLLDLWFDRFLLFLKCSLPALTVTHWECKRCPQALDYVTGENHL